MRATCPACQAPGSFCISLEDQRYHLTDHRADYFRCQRCASLFQFPAPQPGLLATFYGRGYWLETPTVSGILPRLQAIYIRLMLKLDLMHWIRRAGFQPSDQLVDLGCSRGDWPAHLAQQGFSVRGVEGNPGAARFARERHGLDVACCELGSWTPATASVDGLTLFHVLEHVRDPYPLLKTCHRALRHKGRILIRVPNLSSWQARLLGWKWKGLEPPRHIVNFSRQGLLKLVERAGFRIIHQATWSLRDGPPGWSSSLFIQGEPAHQAVTGKSRPSATLAYLLLTWIITPLEWLASLCRRGAMITLIAEKETHHV